MYCMESKYHDRFCIKDGFLFVLRQGKCTDSERVYLFPAGDRSDFSGVAAAVREIIEDAHSYGKLARFETVTESAKIFLTENMPGQFEFDDLRDWYEYIYTNERLSLLSGPDMASKRHDLATFFRDYGERSEIRRITSADLEDIRIFQKKWLEEKLHNEEDVQLDCENDAIQCGLDCFGQLGFSGIVVYIDGSMAGYAYGAPLSDNTFDVVIEKGDRQYPDIYKVLNRDLVRLCCEDFDYINREEDIGVPGLRKAKLSYKPDFMLKKYVAKEVLSE